MLLTLIRLATGSILLLALVACPATSMEDTPTASVLSVTIDGGDQTIAVGATLTLTATVATTGNASDTVTWSSSNTTIATIDVDGVLEAPTAGATTITATSAADATKSDSITRTVNPPGTLRWTRQYGTSDRDRHRRQRQRLCRRLHAARPRRQQRR